MTAANVSSSAMWGSIVDSLKGRTVSFELIREFFDMYHDMFNDYVLGDFPDNNQAFVVAVPREDISFETRRAMQQYLALLLNTMADQGNVDKTYVYVDGVTWVA
jgi:hypothetical protein